MNFNWKCLAERGDYPIGFVDVYKLLNDSRKAIAMIYYLPQHSHHIKQRVILTLLLEGQKGNWTEGTINQIFEDAEARILNACNFKFNNLNLEPLKFADTQLFYIKSIEGFDYLNHGEYSFT